MGKALETALTEAAMNQGAWDYSRTLQKMMAQAKDGHGYISGYTPVPEGATQGYLPIALRRIDSKWILVGTGTPLVNLGEQVVSIGGIDIESISLDLAPYIPCSTTQWRDYKLSTRLLMGSFNKAVEVEIAGFDGAGRKVSLTYGSNAVPPSNGPKAVSWVEQEPGIYYINLGLLQQGEVAGLVSRLAAAKGVILDARVYPQDFMGWITLYTYFSSQTLVSARFAYPSPLRPDRVGYQMTPAQNTWSVNSPLITAPKVFLCDEGCLSQMEYLLQNAKGNNLGRIVGAPTGGTNGDINPFTLATGNTVNWTGLRVENVDGSRFHGIGIIPDVLVKPTIAGSAANKDEVLDAALKLLR